METLLLLLLLLNKDLYIYRLTLTVTHCLVFPWWNGLSRKHGFSLNWGVDKMVCLHMHVGAIHPLPFRG